MPSAEALQENLNAAHVEAAVFELRPDYRALLIAVDGLVPGPSERPATPCLSRPKQPPKRHSESRKSNTSRTLPRGGRRTRPSEPSRTEPATASKRWSVARPPASPGSTGSPTSTTQSQCCTRFRSAARTSHATAGHHG